MSNKIAWYSIAISNPKDKGTGKQPEWVFDGKTNKLGIDSMLIDLKNKYPGKLCQIFRGYMLGGLEKEVIL